MALQPDTDADLRRSAKQLRTLGARLLLAGGILFAIGLLLMLAGDGVLDILGILVAAVATPPSVGGVGVADLEPLRARRRRAPAARLDQGGDLARVGDHRVVAREQLGVVPAVGAHARA